MMQIGKLSWNSGQGSRRCTIMRHDYSVLHGAPFFHFASLFCRLFLFYLSLHFHLSAVAATDGLDNAMLPQSALAVCHSGIGHDMGMRGGGASGVSWATLLRVASHLQANLASATTMTLYTWEDALYREGDVPVTSGHGGSGDSSQAVGRVFRVSLGRRPSYAPRDVQGGTDDVEATHRLWQLRHVYGKASRRLKYSLGASCGSAMPAETGMGEDGTINATLHEPSLPPRPHLLVTTVGDVACQDAARWYGIPLVLLTTQYLPKDLSPDGIWLDQARTSIGWSWSMALGAIKAVYGHGSLPLEVGDTATFLRQQRATLWTSKQESWQAYRGDAFSNERAVDEAMVLVLGWHGFWDARKLPPNIRHVGPILPGPDDNDLAAPWSDLKGFLDASAIAAPGRIAVLSFRLPRKTMSERQLHAWLTILNGSLSALEVQWQEKASQLRKSPHNAEPMGAIGLVWVTDEETREALTEFRTGNRDLHANIRIVTTTDDLSGVHILSRHAAVGLWLLGGASALYPSAGLLAHAVLLAEVPLVVLEPRATSAAASMVTQSQRDLLKALRRLGVGWAMRRMEEAEGAAKAWRITEQRLGWDRVNSCPDDGSKPCDKVAMDTGKNVAQACHRLRHILDLSARDASAHATDAVEMALLLHAHTPEGLYGYLIPENRRMSWLVASGMDVWGWLLPLLAILSYHMYRFLFRPILSFLYLNVSKFVALVRKRGGDKAKVE